MSHQPNALRAPQNEGDQVAEGLSGVGSSIPKDQIIPDNISKEEEAKDRALMAARLVLRDNSNKRRRLLRNRSISTALQSNEPQSSKTVQNTNDNNRIESSSTVAVHTQTESKSTNAPKEAEYNEVEEFFNDNAERYQSKQEAPKPVPVLPIVVPEYMRDRVRAMSTAANTQKGHDRPDKKEIIVRPTEGSRSGVLTIDPETQKAAVAYEQEQEAKTKEISEENYQLTSTAADDPMLVAEYEEEIFAYLREAELETLPEIDYTLNSDITPQMRGVLVDWLIEIHYMFRLLPETLFLAVSIIDRFLSKRLVSLGKVQLVGVAALFIATKFEEMTLPRIKDFINMTDKTLKEDELVRAERFVLEVLDFRVCYANPLHFLRRVTKSGGFDVHMRTLAKYFLEISCVDHRFMKIPPSKIAAASLWLSQRMLAKGQWTEESVRLTGYRATDIKPVVQLMLDYLSQPVMHDAFFKKWESKQFLKASVFVRNWVKQYYRNR